MQRSDGLFESGRVAFGLLVFYALTSLTSMAGMSVGITLVLLGTFTGLISSQPFRARFARSAQATFQAPQTRLFLGLTFLLALGLGASLVSLQINPLRPLDESEVISGSRDLGKFLYLAFPFLWAILLGMLSFERQKKVMGAWVAAAGGLGILSIIQFFTGFPRPQVIPTSPKFFHATLFFGHHLSTASILIFPALVALALGFHVRRDSQAPSTRNSFLTSSRFWFVCGALATLAVVLSFSRMAWLALPVGLISVSLKSAGQLHWKRSWTVGILLAVGAMGVALSQSPTVQERIRNPMGISTRFELWKWNFELFQERPIFGVGWRRSEAFVHALLKERLPDPEQRKSVFVGHAHNNGIEMLSGTGLFGSLVWGLYVLFPLVVGYGYRRTPGFSSALVWGTTCAWIVFLLNGLTQVNFWEGKVMHQWAFALGVLLSSLKEVSLTTVPLKTVPLTTVQQSTAAVEATRSSEL